MFKAALRDSLVYGLAAALSRGLAIFLLPLYTRVLSPGDYGAYDLLITLGALANMVVALEISQGLARYWADAGEQAARVRLASTSLWFSILMYALFLAIGLLAAKQLNAMVLGDYRYLDAFRLGVGFIAVNGIYYLLLNQLRWELRSRAYALISVAYALFTLLFTLVFCMWLRLELLGVMLAQLLAALLAGLLCLWLLRKTFGWMFDMNLLRAMLRFSAPLVPAGFAVFISLYVNRFALSQLASLESVGHFGIASRIAGIAALPLLGIQAALTPLVYKHHRDPQTGNQVSKLFSLFVSLALLSCLILSFFSRELLVVLGTTQFMPGAELVRVLAPALLLSQMYIFAPGIGIYKKTNVQLLVTVYSAATSIFGNLLLVPLWGTWGAGIATLLSSLVFFVGWLLHSQKLYPIVYAWREVLAAIASFIFCLSMDVILQTLNFKYFYEIVFKLIIILIFIVAMLASGLVKEPSFRVFASRFKMPS